jgi:hypothetical protein
MLWLVRAVADPHPNEYYYVPFLIATAGWEVYGLGRLPVVCALASACLLVTFSLPFLEPVWPNTFLLAWTLLLGVYLAGKAFVDPDARPAAVHPRSRYFNWWRAPVDLE